ncbi:ATP-binding cassette domain-containing protein [Amycolatopsis thermoflava]|uniref:Peptide/nickel transport system ATP-binding protein/oligopeptide transport system ATP-binding protein n=1 Tax=Amycolatopsis thermoflava TaxID=84480 RepID=A0A3N2GQK7_9PSEU|nr:ATP-binding cassette domain-containing protein [Amycolatopsis thermoflava]ROS38911.1 peptide/nickel transport system ATP-binding protein/oligopeptide transport system ATP-binding protein [Amycolatopsis thermoflava]
MSEYLLEARDVHITYGAKHAVRGVSLGVRPGETLGVVGESGSGKSSLGRAMVGLERLHAGEIVYDGTPLSPKLRLPRAVRLDLQMVFQDPASALNPRRKLGRAVAEAAAARTGKLPARDELAALFAHVGLDASFLDRYPSQASGGQLQRVVLARALAVRPKVLVADEPVSALDVSVQAQVLNLLCDLRAELDLSIVFVSHDIAVVRHMADRVAVMYQGELVESGDAEELVANPRHEYTRALLEAVPDPDVVGALAS